MWDSLGLTGREGVVRSGIGVPYGEGTDWTLRRKFAGASVFFDGVSQEKMGFAVLV